MSSQYGLPFSFATLPSSSGNSVTDMADDGIGDGVLRKPRITPVVSTIIGMESCSVIISPYRPRSLSVTSLIAAAGLKTHLKMFIVPKVFTQIASRTSILSCHVCVWGSVRVTGKLYDQEYLHSLVFTNNVHSV